MAAKSNINPCYVVVTIMNSNSCSFCLTVKFFHTCYELGPVPKSIPKEICRINVSWSAYAFIFIHIVFIVKLSDFEYFELFL